MKGYNKFELALCEIHVNLMYQLLKSILIFVCSIGVVPNMISVYPYCGFNFLFYGIMKRGWEKSQVIFFIVIIISFVIKGMSRNIFKI